MFLKTKELIFCRNRERREDRERSSNFSLRSTELGCSVFVRLITKVHLHDESYAWIPEVKDFAEDSHEKFRRSWVSCLRDFQKLRLRSKR